MSKSENNRTCFSCGEGYLRSHHLAHICKNSMLHVKRPYKKLVGSNLVDSRDKTKWEPWRRIAGKYMLIGDSGRIKRVTYYKLRKYYV